MGQSLSKTSWMTHITSSKNPHINNNLVGEYQLKKTFESVNKNLSVRAIEKNDTKNIETINSDGNTLDGNNITTEFVSNSTSFSPSSSNQVIIRIQLTKMEKNSNNHTGSLGDISSATSEMATLTARSNSNSCSGSSEIIPSLDNNLNITCGTNSIINLTISNNFVCDAPLTTNTSNTLTSSPNNLNIVNSHDSNSNMIHCLNIFDDNIERNLNQVMGERVGTNLNGENIRPIITPQNITNVSGRRAGTDGILCMEGIQCNCSNGNITGNIQKAVEFDCCNSGHSSLCAQSNIDGNGSHCCRSTKKISSAYPSKFRCCKCMCVESIPSNTNNSVEAGSSSVQNNWKNKACNRYQNNSNLNHSSCLNSVNLLPSVNSSRQISAVDTTGQTSHQLFHPNIHQHNVIVLSVNPSVQSIIVDPQQNSHLLPHLHHSHQAVAHHPSIALGGASDLRWLLQPSGPVLCTSAGANTLVAGASGIGNNNPPMVHSQADYRHCLVPDLEKIFSSTFYWGKMDRYEAERLLEGKAEGTFLLRDSAQEEYLFSVTFRKYGRSLHARIEQLGHKFSFDCHDPGVYTASTVTGLLEHYKDPSCVMFFEPMLTIPLHRKFSFSLQQLCRATIVSHITYDGINELHLPSSLKAYLKEYHYKYKVRETPLDDSMYLCS